ncbi:HD domain-containing protein [Nocardiopsis kunsanensis]|uniref:5'-deoxynucleotidase n=1 Tax=Nocardiopsis kunsanensis TaxID=141693 RepID=A0A919CM45_9ACTN|nr:HD domain-containing protein [Nocardiopsis kunsanensis]GHD37868.1 haloacid dehalogenase [Nocardiopsis kunsanensis]
MADEQDVRALDYLYEAGLLKRYRRTGWVVAGVAAPESIADHSHRAAIVAAVVAELEGADPQRSAFLALFHDTQESRLTDIPYIGKRYLKAASNAEVTADQTAGMPEGLARLIGGTESEYEARESAEAVCARDADKLECLLQAVEYREQGTDTQAWIDTSFAALKTSSAQRLAKLALERTPLAWMHEARDAKSPK